MTYYLKRGSQFSVTSKGDMDLHESLPVGTYTVGCDPMTGSFFLIQVEGFTLNQKIYGDTTKQSERILNTFASREASTGVLLFGEKGSGKTLLAKKLSLDSQAAGIPTIQINQPWAGESFNNFMQTIDQPVVVLFDEFEKVYDSQTQEQMLTLLDGVYPSKKLFVLTSNDKYRIDQHMRNRPGRVFYSIEFDGLDQAFIREYCEDNLDNLEHVESVCRAAMLFGKFNFDMLKALVEEMNRYKETAQDALKLLNAKPVERTSQTFNATLTVEGKPVSKDDLMDRNITGNPLMTTFMLSYYFGEPDDEGDRDYEHAVFAPEHLTKVEVESGRFFYENAKKQTLSLVQAPVATPVWHDMMA